MWDVRYVITSLAEFHSCFVSLSIFSHTFYSVTKYAHESRSSRHVLSGDPSEICSIFFPSLGSISVSSLSTRVILNIQFSCFVGVLHCLLMAMLLVIEHLSEAVWFLLLTSNFVHLTIPIFLLGLGNCCLTVFMPLLFFLGAFFLLHTYSSMCSRRQPSCPRSLQSWARLTQAPAPWAPAGVFRHAIPCSPQQQILCFVFSLNKYFQTSTNKGEMKNIVIYWNLHN